MVDTSVKTIELLCRHQIQALTNKTLSGGSPLRLQFPEGW